MIFRGLREVVPTYVQVHNRGHTFNEERHGGIGEVVVGSNVKLRDGGVDMFGETLCDVHEIALINVELCEAQLGDVLRPFGRENAMRKATFPEVGHRDEKSRRF